MKAYKKVLVVALILAFIASMGATAVSAQTSESVASPTVGATRTSDLATVATSDGATADSSVTASAPIVSATYQTPTTLVLFAASQSVKLNDQTQWVRVILRSGGAILSGQAVELYAKVGTGNWFKYSDGTTDGNGAVTWYPGSSGAIIAQFRVVYAGTGTDAGATSNVVTIKYENATTTTTALTASTTTPIVGQTVTFTVTLKAGTTGLSKPVTLWHTEPNGAAVEDGTHNTVNGVYTFTQSFSSPGERVYIAVFAGEDSTYGASSGSVTVNVGTTTTTTLTASTTTPLVGQTVTFTVNLKSGTTGLSKPVTLWHTEPNGAAVEDGTHNTVNGVYSFTQAFGSTGQRIYHAEFAGDGTYGASSGTVTVNVVGSSGTTTTTTLTASTTTPAVGQSVTFTVTLKAGTTGLSKAVKIWHTTADGVRYEDGTHATVNGAYTFTQSFVSKGQRIYHAEFAGDSMYAASAGTVTVDVVIPPTLTLSSTSYSVTAGQQYTLSGLLTDGAGNPLANKPIDIFYHFPNEGWQLSNTVYTNAAGWYSTITTSSKTITLQTGYKVGGVYVASSNVVTITVV